jgi:hypothetical protein
VSLVSRVPECCRDLDMARVSRVLAEHHAHFPMAARELGVSEPDLRRLTWARPRLLDEAHEEMELVVRRARGELISALFDPDSTDRRREWAADWILRSWIARDSPFAPARRATAGTRARAAASGNIAVVLSFEEKRGVE